MYQCFVVVLILIIFSNCSFAKNIPKSHQIEQPPKNAKFIFEFSAIEQQEIGWC